MEMPGFQMLPLLTVHCLSNTTAGSKQAWSTSCSVSEADLIACVNVRTLYELAGCVDPREPLVSSFSTGAVCDGGRLSTVSGYETKNAASLWNQGKARSWHTLQAETKRNVPGVHLEPVAQLPGKGVARLPHQ